MSLCGTWDRNNPRLLSEQPSECDPSRSRFLPLRDAAEQVNQGLIRLESLRRKARESAAEVGAVERRVFVHRSRQEALAERAIWHESNREFLKGRYHFLLGGSRPQRVFALESSDWLDCVRATYRLHSRFGKTEVLDLACLNQFLHRAGHVFDRHVRVNPVLIEQVDCLYLEPRERAFDSLLDVLRPAIQARRAPHPPRIKIGTQVETKLGGDHNFPKERSEGFAHKLFVQERAVHLGGVEECDATFHGGTEKRGHLLLVFGRTVRKAHSHAAEPESRYFQAAIP